MTLLRDLHHVTFLTADMDRLIAFYERVFDARVTVDLMEEVVWKKPGVAVEAGLKRADSKELRFTERAGLTRT